MAVLRRQSPPELGDDGAPLLGQASQERLALYCRKAQDGLREWWRVTTCDVFLASSGSRRDLWSIISPLFLCTSCFGDSAWGSPRSLLVAEGVACLISPVLGLLPPAALRSDAIKASYFLLLALVIVLTVPAGAAQLAFNASYYALDLTISGVHSSAIVTYFIVCSALFSCLGAEGLATLLAAGPLVSALAVMLEYRAALCVDAVQKQQEATRDLLDKAGDGFCTIDAGTGLISGASPKLRRTFAASRGLLGRHFHDFVMATDVQYVQALCSAAQAGEPLQEALVTCRVPGSSEGEDMDMLLVFEAKLIPHIAGDAEFCICVQVQGEMRLQPARAEAVQAPPEPEEQFSRASSFTYSVSVDQGSCRLQQEQGHELPRKRTLRTHPVGAPNRIDTATQTAGRPPLGGRPPLAPGAAKSRTGSYLGRRPRARSRARQKLLPRFEPTPATTVTDAVMQTVKGFNVCGRGCCSWHILWRIVLHELGVHQCRPEFSPYEDFQCAHCKAMNEWSQDEDPDQACCSFCGGPPLEQQGSGTATSGNEAGDAEFDSTGNSPDI